MPQETIITAPAKLYYAAYGAALPTIKTHPPAPATWTEFGQSYWHDGGLTLAVDASVIEERIDGSPFVQDAFLDTADLTVSGVIKDFSLETIALLLNGQAVTTTAAAGTNPGVKTVDLKMGLTIPKRAIAVRFYTPYNEGALTAPDFAAQLWLPAGYFPPGLNAALTRGQAARSPASIKAIEHPTLGVGKLTFKNANAP